MKRPEQSLHLAVARYLAVALRPPTFWTSIEHATKLGPVAAGMRKARGVKPGLPDLVIMHPGRPVFGVELKAPKGKLSDAQVTVQAFFRNCGHNYECCKSVEELQALLERYRIPLHAKLT